MSKDFQQVRAIFLAALEKPAEQWSAHLSESCGEDNVLREQVELLLKAHRETSGMLDRAAPVGSPTIAQPITEKPGTQIGPYKLLQQIGEGGMGVVYMAEQKEPVKRRVALKIIKPGMDTRQVIARFEAERQALAMMDHPNIAKVLDAGATESGLPYFVMELVNGLPVTKYCDEQHLTPKERLELFIPICQAAQHAHQKGIIHRDLKPSNILVALYDSQPVPKIIDFGVAKATSQTLTEKTMFTQLGQVVGTLEYMSPEQAERNQLDIDTRSDIYSLGVVLYELLTGETPFDRERLRSAAWNEMLRIIREEEPSKPSTKVSSSRSLPTIAANRRMDPARLGSMIRGELDWIVLKALEKDRSRRYETASKFAEDVENYMRHKTVEACPPSAAYRMRKFVRRNKAAIVTMSLVAAALLSGASAAAWQAFRATWERNRAVQAEAAASVQAQRADEQAKRAESEAQKALAEAAISKAVNKFLNEDLLAQADPYESSQKDITLREVVQRASQNIESRFGDQPLVKAAIHYNLSDVLDGLGDYNKALKHAQLATDIRREVLGENDPSTLEGMDAIAHVYYSLGMYESCEQTARRLQKLGQRISDPEFSKSVENLIARAIHRQGRHKEAEVHYRRALELHKQASGIEDCTLLHNLAYAIAEDDPQKAEPLLRRALALARIQHGEDSIQSAPIMDSLAKKCLDSESPESARLREKAFEIRLKILGPRHPHAQNSFERLLTLETQELARLANAEDRSRALDQASARWRSFPPEIFQEFRGRIHMAFGEWNKAIEYFSRAADESPDTLQRIHRLRAFAFMQLQQWDKAAQDLWIPVREDPHAPVNWMCLAPTLLLADDEAAYQDCCRRVLEQFRNTSSAHAADVTCKICLLRPDVVTLSELPVKVLNESVNGPSPGDANRFWFWACKGLFEHRSGNPEAAIECVERSLGFETIVDRAIVLDRIVLAMAQHQSGRDKLAREALADAATIIRQLEPEMDARAKQTNLQDLLVAKVLYAEANELIHGDDNFNAGTASSASD